MADGCVKADCEIRSQHRHAPGWGVVAPQLDGSVERPPGHGGNAVLSFDEDPICPGCEAGGACDGIFEHPIYGQVACCADL